MKRFAVFVLAAVMLLGVLTGCGAKQGGGIEGTMEEAIDKIYAEHKEIDLSLVTMPLDISDADAVAYNTGLSSGDKLTQAAVSETMLGQPYSLVVVRVKDPADAASVAKEMYEKIDMRKWICVAADTKVAAYSGDVAMFFMVSSDFAQDASTETILKAFTAACGGTATQVS